MRARCAQIIVTEVGDETFIIAAIMAMRHPRLVVYAGAMTALIFMTVRAPGAFDRLLLCYLPVVGPPHWLLGCFVPYT